MLSTEVEVIADRTHTHANGSNRAFDRQDVEWRKMHKETRCETGCGNNKKTKNKIGIESADDEVCSTLG